jgi:hypothetical protein
MHARVIASKYERGSATFYANFREFVECLEDSIFDEDYTGGKAVARAYWAFLACVGTEITKVNDVAAEV